MAEVTVERFHDVFTSMNSCHCERTTASVTDEYESAAEWCAQRNLKGDVGDPLPELLSTDVSELIDADVHQFKEAVSRYAYALAMERTDAQEPE